MSETRTVDGIEWRRTPGEFSDERWNLTEHDHRWAKNQTVIVRLGGGSWMWFDQWPRVETDHGVYRSLRAAMRAYAAARGEDLAR